MSFRLNPNPTFKAAVPLSVPGLEQPLSVSMTFRHKTQEQLADWMARAPGRSDPDVLGEVLVDWDGVQDDDGGPVPFSYANLVALLGNYPASKGEIFSTYLAELTKAKRKNS
jgi:hypothetical protein